MKLIGRPLPDELDEFFTRCANGIILFAGELNIHGLRVEGKEQPYDLQTVPAPPDAEEHMFFFGSWGDVHPLYIDTNDGSVHGASRESAESLCRWESFSELLVGETDRLAALYEPDGTRKEPYGSAPEEQDADARGEAAKTSTDVELPAKFGDAVVEVVDLLERAPREVEDLALRELEIVDRTDQGVTLRHDSTDPDDDWQSWHKGWLEIGSDGLGDPWLVDLTQDGLPVHWIGHDTDSTYQVASTMQLFTDALRTATEVDDPRQAVDRIVEADPGADRQTWELLLIDDTDEDA